MRNIINEKKGKEKKKITPKDITAVHRTIIAANAMKEIIKERDQYSRLFEESARACRLTIVDKETLLTRERNIEPALPPANELIPDMFQEPKIF